METSGGQAKHKKIDRAKANQARNKTKTVFKGNGGVADLKYEELLVLLADVTTELNKRRAAGTDGGPPGIYGPVRNIARRILE